MGQYFTNDILKSEYRNIVYKYDDKIFNFLSDLGVFSKDRVDYASKLLLETYFKYGKKNINGLDVGCGYGFIGVTLSKMMNINFDMIDVNKRALHLTEINIKNNKVLANSFESDIYSNIEKKYDLIITNPPIRAGKNVYMKFLFDSINYLTDDGEFWFVMNKSHGAKTTIDLIKSIYNVNILKKDKGFFVVLCKKR